jgi:hypothetical protein
MVDLGVAGGTEASTLRRKANSNDKAWRYQCITRMVLPLVPLNLKIPCEDGSSNRIQWEMELM